MKKILFAVVMGLLCFSFVFATASAQSFKDNLPGSLYYDAVEFLSEEGVVEGYPDGTFEPDNTLSRAEFLAIIMRANDIETEFIPQKDCFEDVLEGIWFYDYICTAKKKGLVVGYANGTFRPGLAVSYVEAQKMVMNFDYAPPKTDIWYEGIVQTASKYDLIPITIKNFEQKVTRAEMADMVTRVFKHQRNGGEDLYDYVKRFNGYKVDLSSINKGEDIYQRYKLVNKAILNVEGEFCYYDGGTYSSGSSIVYNSCTTCQCVNGEIKYCTGVCTETESRIAVDFDNAFSKVWYDKGKLKVNYSLENKGDAIKAAKMQLVIYDNNLRTAAIYKNDNFNFGAGMKTNAEGAVFGLDPYYNDRMLGGTVTIHLYVNNSLVGNNAWTVVDTSDYDASDENGMLSYDTGLFTINYYKDWQFYLENYETPAQTYVLGVAVGADALRFRKVATTNYYSYVVDTLEITNPTFIIVDGHGGYKFSYGDGYGYVIKLNDNYSVFAWMSGMDYFDDYDYIVRNIDIDPTF